jgi:phosphoglycerate dehydrogenase-like enzyme
LNNVIVTPHCGGAHDRYAEFVLPIVEKNLQFLLDGREAEMINRVDYKHAGK